MSANTKHFPRKGNKPMPMVYSTTDRFGDFLHTNYGGKLDLGGCRTGAGVWWPDFGPTVRDFSAGGINHPTEHVFHNAVEPLKRTQSEPNKSLVGQGFRKTHFDIADEKPQQFRRPQPSSEALYSSTINMPYKSGGRRKCAEAANWKACLSSGAEGMTHGGRYPIWAKGPLLDNPDFYQKHPLKRHEMDVTISATCVADGAAAGGASGTSAVDDLFRSGKSPQDLGLRDAKTIRKTLSNVEDIDVRASFRSSATRLASHKQVRTANSDVGSELSSRATSLAMPRAMPSWIASQTVATRDPKAAGHAGGTIRKLATSNED